MPFTFQLSNSNPFACAKSSLSFTIATSFASSGSFICTVGLLYNLSFSPDVFNETVNPTVFFVPTGNVVLSCPKSTPSSTFVSGLVNVISFICASVSYTEFSSSIFCIAANELNVNFSILSILLVYSVTFAIFKFLLFSIFESNQMGSGNNYWQIECKSEC